MWASRRVLEGQDAVPSALETKNVLRGLLDNARATEPSSSICRTTAQNDNADGSPDGPHTGGWQLVFAPLDGEMVVQEDDSDSFASNARLAGILRDGEQRSRVSSGPAGMEVAELDEAVFR